MTKTTNKRARSRRRSGGRGRRRSPRVILLAPSRDWSDWLKQGEFVSCSSADELTSVIELADRNSRWISRSKLVGELIGAATVSIVQHSGREPRLGRLLMLTPPDADDLPALHGLFDSVLGADPRFRSLPAAELGEVLSAPAVRQRDLVVGGIADVENEVLVLTRGDLSRIVVPFVLFEPSESSGPDFDRLGFTDYGQTIRLGDFEVGTDFVLYAVDPDFRRRVNARRRERAQGFGPSLRRLRILRQLGRDAFTGLSEKTIARIERGEVADVRPATMRIICKVLGMSEEEIETY